MFEGVKGLLDSKKAIPALLLIAGATALTLTGKMSVAEWRDYTMWIFIAYAGAETANGVAATLKGAPGRKTPNAVAEREAPVIERVK